MNSRILIADGHDVIRAGMRAMLERIQGVEIVAEATDCDTARSLCGQLAPDIVMLDESIPLLVEIELIRRIVQRRSDLRVIVCGVHREPGLIEQAFRAGANGYLLKDSPASEVTIALRAVQRGDVYMSPKVAEVLAKGYLRIASNAQLPGQLSRRERDVLQLLVDGKTNREISDRLRISIKTVETHRAKLMEKLNLFSVAELTKYALREGLTSLET